MSEITWYIRHSSQLISMGDEFVEGSFRVILRGTTLAVKIEGCLATMEVVNRAERLAKNYIDNLGPNLGEQLQLLTEEEFRSLPPGPVKTRPWLISRCVSAAAMWQEILGKPSETLDIA